MSQPNKLNIAKWIVALRSGLYQQTQGVLKDLIGYCCLGVACAISKLGQWNPDDYYTNGLGLGSASALPDFVQEWLGLSLRNPTVSLSGISAQNANDGLGWTFAQIADGLEALYLGQQKAEDIVRIALAEPEAWLVLAEAHDAGQGSFFLCNTLGNPLGCGASTVAQIPADVRQAMRSRIEAAINPDIGVAYDSRTATDEEQREGRVLACLMFAEIAADEVA